MFQTKSHVFTASSSLAALGLAVRHAFAILYHIRLNELLAIGFHFHVYARERQSNSAYLQHRVMAYDGSVQLVS